MTFVVNQDGEMYQKDLGPTTSKLAKCRPQFDPDARWQKVGALSAIPEGISSIFDRAPEQTRRSGPSEYEDEPAKQLLAVSSYKRELAATLGADV
jgi:hypothetical protein